MMIGCREKKAGKGKDDLFIPTYLHTYSTAQSAIHISSLLHRLNFVETPERFSPPQIVEISELRFGSPAVKRFQ
jgi:hypothetical protein